MPVIQLAGGSYQDRSLIAAAQRCLNLYMEPLPPTTGEQISYVHLPTPGLLLQAQAPELVCRCLYRASTGYLYGVFGQSVYYIDSNMTFWKMGGLTPSQPSDATPRTTPCYMSDNGSVLIVVDNSIDGWWSDITQPLTTQTLHRIDQNINTGWYGSKYAQFQSTFFIFNKPNSNIMYISESEVVATTLTDLFTVISATIVAIGLGYSAGDILTIPDTGSAQITVNTVNSTGQITAYGVTAGGHITAQPANPVIVSGGSGSGATFNLQYTNSTGAFNPLDFAAKSINPDDLVAVISVHTVLWLIGKFSYECWFLSGGGIAGGLTINVFPFEGIPSAFANYGCVAPDSIATNFNQIYFLHQDSAGRGMVMQGEGYSAKRISTFAIENSISEYGTISDAVGYCYQQGGHIFYVITFPSANNSRGATWVYDNTVGGGMWHERAWCDDNGIEYRHRANFAVECYDQVFAGDWENNNLYSMSLDCFNDFGSPIKRLRSFPHILDLEANRRISYTQLIANMQVGTAVPVVLPVVRCTFNAPDGTRLENYISLGDIGSKWTQEQFGAEGTILDHAVTSNGPVTYLASGIPPSPDCTLIFAAIPSDFGAILPPYGAGVGVIARGNDNGTKGYAIRVFSDGTDFDVSLQALPDTNPLAQVGMGLIESGFFIIITTLVGSLITVSCQRTQDAKWLSGDGTWGALQTTTISLDNSTYADAGRVLLQSGPFNPTLVTAPAMHTAMGVLTVVIS